MLRRLRRLKMSLATKCQLLFGIAAGIIILASLAVRHAHLTEHHLAVDRCLRKQNNKEIGLNWGGIAPAWAGGYAVFSHMDTPAHELVDFSNFFRGVYLMPTVISLVVVPPFWFIGRRFATRVKALAREQHRDIRMCHAATS